MNSLARWQENDDQVQAAHDTASYLLRQAAKKHCDILIAVSYSKGISVTTSVGQLDQLLFIDDQSMTLTLFHEQRTASVSGQDLGKANVDLLFERAWSMLQLMASDPWAGLPDLDRVATSFPDLATQHESNWTAPELIDRALALDRQIAESDARIQCCESASFSSRQDWSGLWHNRHFAGTYRGTYHTVSASAVASDQQGMQRDGYYRVARPAYDLPADSIVAHETVKRTVARLSPRKIKSGKYPVLFHPEVALSLLDHLVKALSGGYLYQEASFLRHHLDKQVFPSSIHIIENPFWPKGLASCAYDDEGVAPIHRSVVASGVIKSFLLSSYTARRLGMMSTGNAGGVYNLSVQPTIDEDHTALIGQITKGLLITEVMGPGVNITNGDYSRGASGFWIEQGQIQFPVQEITLAGNLLDLFSKLTAVSCDAAQFWSTRTGGWLVDQMMVASS